MFVCICKAITDRDVESAIENGARSVEEVGETTGAGTDCGSCQNALEVRVKRACTRMSGGDCGASRETMTERT